MRHTKGRQGRRAVIAVVAATAMLLGAWAVPASGAPPGGVKVYSSPLSLPSGITAGVDGNLWFGSIFGTGVARVTPAGVITTFTDPQGEVSGARSFASGAADSKVWFVSGANNRVGNVVVTPAFGGTVGDIHTFTNAAIDAPTDIAADGDGNLWFTHDGGIGRVTPGGTITNFSPAALAGGTDQVARDNAGNIWFTDFDDDLIGRVVVATSTITTFPVPSGMNHPFGIGLGADGSLWYTTNPAGKVGVLTTAGAFSQSFTVPSNVRADGEIVQGADGAMYFHSSSNRIGRISTAGAVSSYYTSKLSTATGIAAGPDGNVWFTSAFNNKVGYLVPDGANRPDAQVGTSATGAFKGNNAYATTVGDPVQTQSRTVTLGGTTEIWLRVQNDGATTGSFVVRADESGAAGITFKYTSGATDVSTQVRGSGFTISNLAPGATADIRIKVKGTTSSSAGQTHQADITVSSATANAARDVVRATATRT